MDCLHGVLMHNDEARGEKHTAEDQYLRFKGVLDTAKEPAGPPDAESQMHGILMHGDSEAKGHETVHDKILPGQTSKAGPIDLSQVVHEGMHGDEGTHVKHDWSKEKKSRDSESSGPFGETFMHGVLMHGDEKFEHNEDSHADKTSTNEGKPKVGPKDAAEHLHGVLMHGDSEPGKEHTHEVPVGGKEGEKKIGPNNDLHGVLMHGDSNLGHDHSKEDANKEHDVFSDISKIKDIGLDEDLLKHIDIKRILEKDKQEYADWIINNPQFQDDSMMGTTLASVSDTILQDIELMKKRYLAKNNKIDENEKEKSVQRKDDHPFTAEDAKAVYDGSLHAEEGEDLRHDLELLGSTEPLNARHKAKLALLKYKSEK